MPVRTDSMLNFHSDSTGEVFATSERDGAITLRAANSSLPVVAVVSVERRPSGNATHMCRCYSSVVRRDYLWCAWSNGALVTIADGATDAEFVCGPSPSVRTANLLPATFNGRDYACHVSCDGAVAFIDASSRLMAFRAQLAADFWSIAHLFDGLFVILLSDGTASLQRIALSSGGVAGFTSIRTLASPLDGSSRAVTQLCLCRHPVGMALFGTDDGQVVALDCEPHLLRVRGASQPAGAAIASIAASSRRFFVAGFVDCSVSIMELSTLAAVQRVRLASGLVCVAVSGFGDNNQFALLLSDRTLRSLTLNDELDDDAFLPSDGTVPKQNSVLSLRDVIDHEATERRKVADEQNAGAMSIVCCTVTASLEREHSLRQENTVLEKLLTALHADRRQPTTFVDSLATEVAKLQWMVEGFTNERDAAIANATTLLGTCDAMRIELDGVYVTRVQLELERVVDAESLGRCSIELNAERASRMLESGITTVYREFWKANTRSLKQHLESTIQLNDDLQQTVQNLRRDVAGLRADHSASCSEHESLQLCTRQLTLEKDDTILALRRELASVAQRAKHSQAICDELQRQSEQNAELAAASLSTAKENADRASRFHQMLRRLAADADRLAKLCEGHVLAATEVPTIAQTRTLLRDAQFDLAAARRGATNTSPSSFASEDNHKLTDAFEKVKLAYEHCLDSRGMECIVLDRTTAIEAIQRLRATLGRTTAEAGPASP